MLAIIGAGYGQQAQHIPPLIGRISFQNKRKRKAREKQNRKG